MNQRPSNPAEQHSDSEDNENSGQPMEVYRPEFVVIQYPELKRIQQKYDKLVIKDLKLAEVLRLANPNIPPEEKKINPFHTRVSRKGILWVDVMLERRPEVTIDELERVMQVYGRSGRGPFITGRVRLERLPELDKMTVRMQTGRPVAPLSTYYYSIKDIKTNRRALAGVPGLEDIDGTGVIIGFVDQGCDFNHRYFKVNNQTRLLYLWDQNRDSADHPTSYNYGTEHTRDSINAALRSTRDPYETLKYQPGDEAHGTKVMDIAAGSPSPDDEYPEYPGVAPKADLIFVDLRQPARQANATDEELNWWQLNTLGSTQALLDAVKYIFERAVDEEKPCVVNISLGANGGGHNGTSLVESAFDHLLTEPAARYGRAIVIGAGNDFKAGQHTSGTVQRGNSTLIKWNIPKLPDAPGLDLRQELEIWYPGDTALKIEVLDRDNQPMDSLLCRFEQTCRSNEPGLFPIWTIHNAIAHKAIDLRNNHIHILVDNHHPDFKAGVWSFRLSHDEPRSHNDRDVPFHAWIERYQQRSTESQSTNTGTRPQRSEFDGGSQSSTTVNGIGNARLPIVVGAGQRDSTNRRKFIAWGESSAGPSLNPDAQYKPEVYAPGDSIMAACRLFGSDTRFAASGTSMAAPHVSGVIALMFQKGLRLSPPRVLTMQEIRSILMGTASDRRGYRDQLGFGRVNGRNALIKISKLT